MAFAFAVDVGIRRLTCELAHFFFPRVPLFDSLILVECGGCLIELLRRSLSGVCETVLGFEGKVHFGFCCSALGSFRG